MHQPKVRLLTVSVERLCGAALHAMWEGVSVCADGRTRTHPRTHAPSHARTRTQVIL
jgi:hypothetical protein